MAPATAGRDGGCPSGLGVHRTDDPLTFATDLRAEYQLVHDTLVLAGCSEAEAGEWIDAARKNGLAYRFTVPWQSLPFDVWKAHRANPALLPLHPREPP